MRPFVHVNCAMSADGKIAGPDRKQMRISSEEDIARVRDLRREHDSILVGVGTVISDNPHLTVKGLGYDDNPVRVVIDPHGRTPDDALVLDERAPTVMVTSSSCDREWDAEEIVRAGDPLDLNVMLEALDEIGIDSVLVEGGGETIARFFKAGLVDKYTVFVGPWVIGGKASPTPADGDDPIMKKMTLESAEILGNGVLLTFTL
ncbi:MAG: dihydrofolate reductase family protein [Candidatus Methanomethylophilaceae archaeon]|jgi:2,5-diamino-6-(ribosylamino)-4(3H)-pyrimidinone 5'-phosphate reductase|nr:riboflavin deaminase [Methanomassiliicoccales archaeon RumEn M2]MDD2778737.1 dihydrofolate reductase family protein [Candidatus Methanomethylophilaceae archaeon]MDI9378133.1 dihydrofolate reductase family protein [Candidatus Thermoplasmatota archaeon]MDD3128631.1 dihydrofolate reductase family protein [Candidatus Methanomethylophilaceae archaeon]MDD4119158.1 dihydrofolate reductase family protein [Candidatus Methanomethylophilaceae archaeon]